MKKSRAVPLLCLAFVAVFAVACGTQAPPTQSAADRVATRVAEELAIAATLTARPSQPTAIPPSSAPPSPTPPPPAPEPTRAQNTPTAVARPPSPTPIPPTATRAAAPSPTRILVAVLPVDGSNGNQNLHNSRSVKNGRNILLPGFAQSQASNPMIFRDRLVFQVEVFDAAAGNRDGDGIQNVRFVIYGPNGQVHERVENTASYCVFGGGEPDCVVWVFAEHGAKWPDGADIVNGVHNVTITITPKNGAPVDWFWPFEIQRQK